MNRPLHEGSGKGERHFRGARSARRGGLVAAALLCSAAGALAQVEPQGLRGHGGPVRAITALPDAATLVSGGFDSAIIVWDLGTGFARRVLRYHDSTVNALAALEDGCFASAGEDARIAIWCGNAPSPVRVLTGHTGPIAALAVAPGGRRLASASWDRTVRLWSLAKDGASAEVVAEHAGPVNGVAFLADGETLASASYDGQVRLTRPGGAPRQAQLPAALNGLAVVPDGRIAVSGADGRVRFLDGALAVTGEIDLAEGPLTAIAVSPDGRTLATAGLRTPVTLIDAASGRATSRILGPGLPIWSLTFSRDGVGLFSGGVDRAVRRWEASTGRAAGGAISEPVNISAGATDEPGARVFRACAACHGVTADDVGRAGPSLHGVFGRRIGTGPGYVYSQALTRLDIVWSAETISKLFEIGPNAYTPGTKMPEQRITDPADRKALVDWLAQVSRP